MSTVKLESATPIPIGANDSAASAPIEQIDFLVAPFREGVGISRAGKAFDVARPWATAQFGACHLKRGWWMFECLGADPAGVELHLTSLADPQVVISGATTGERYWFSGVEPFDVSLLISPWPGRQTFTTIRLRRLTGREEAAFLLAGVRRLLTRDRPLARIAQAATRVMSRRAVGVTLVGAGGASGRMVPRVADFGGREPLLVVQERADVRAVIAEGDRLEARAFDIVAAEFARRPEVQAAYCDTIEAGRLLPKTQWDSEAARWRDLAGLPLFFRRGVECGSDPRSAFTRIAASGGAVRIPLPLARRESSLSTSHKRPDPPIGAPRPLVSIVVPTKLRLDLFERCLHGLRNASAYPDFEVVVVDNGCEDPRFSDVLEHAKNALRLKRIVDRGDFNFPRLINFGVRESSGEIVVLLNDDVEAIQPDWLSRLVDAALQPEVGAVGARLVYPDGSIQHAGVMLGLGGVCGHLWKGMSAEAAELNPHVALPGQRMAVTGACLALRRELFDAVGGMDEDAFPVAFNDVDLCLRLREGGHRTVYRGDAVLIHHESQSRGADHISTQRRARLKVESERFLRRWRHLLNDDPFASPALDRRSEAGLIRFGLSQSLD